MDSAGAQDFRDGERAAWETLSRHGSAAFAYFAADLRCRHASRAFAELYGLPADEVVLGRSAADLLPSPLGAFVEDRLREALETGARQADGDLAVEVPRHGGQRRHEVALLPVVEAQGVVGVLVVADDVTERRRHEDLLRATQWRTARLQMMTAQLAGVLTVEDVRRTVATLGRSIGAVHSEIRLLPAENFRFPWPKVPGPRAARRARRLPDDWPRAVLTAVGEGMPLYFPRAEELHTRFGVTALAAQDGGVPEAAAWVVLPLVASGTALGALWFAFPQERNFGPDDRVFLEALAGQCALAIERARLYERERNAALSLQSSLLPEELPSLPGVEVAFRYLPGAADVEVGGDWYDAFPLSGGRVAMVVGDVIGKGLTAAAGMGRVRTALRALAFTDPDPATVLNGLDRLFDATEKDESLTTLLYAVVTPNTGELVIAEAGHLPALIVSADGTARFVDAGPPSTPLGVSEPRRQKAVRLREADMIIGFSDGLVENHRRSFTDGLDVLQAAVTGYTGSPEALLDHVLDRLLDGQERDDDVTVLAMRLTAPLSGAVADPGSAAAR